MPSKTFIFIIIMIVYLFAQGTEDLLEKIDRFRMGYPDFEMEIRLTEFKNGEKSGYMVLHGLFKGSDKSVLMCTEGKNKNMKILMNGDYLWINLPGSARALRITPMQRLMGQASNGDVARISFRRDYSVEKTELKGDTLLLDLRAKSESATYNRILLFVRRQGLQPIKSYFYLHSGKKMKTAYYETFFKSGDQYYVRRIRITDELRPSHYTVVEFGSIRERKIPAKYFNVMYLHKLRF